MSAYAGSSKNLKDLKHQKDQSTLSRSPRAICTVVLILEILCCYPKGRRALLRVPSTEGRGVRICWAHSYPKRPQGPGQSPFTLASKKSFPRFLQNSQLQRDLRILSTPKFDSCLLLEPERLLSFVLECRLKAPASHLSPWLFLGRDCSASALPTNLAAPPLFFSCPLCVPFLSKFPWKITQCLGAICI